MAVAVVLFFTGTYAMYLYNGQTRIVDVVEKKEYKKIVKPDFDHDNNQAFLTDLIQCVEYIYHYTDITPVNLELLLAQASLESAWGNSRFAKEGNNLFGIRIWNRDKGMLPAGYNETLSWRVKSYHSKCSSVRDYITILNTKAAYSEFRKIRDSQNRLWSKPDSIALARGLDSWSTTKDYDQQVINIIKKLRQDGKVVIKR